jgi:hemerythrin-like metal-binding protein
MNEGSPFGRVPLQHLSLSRMMQFGDHLRVDHAVLDAQHKAIFDLGVKVYEDWRRGESLDVLRPALDKLSDLLHTHFRSEERVLEAIGFDDLPSHVAEHQKLGEELAAVRARLARVEDGTKAPTGPNSAAVQFILGLTVGHVAGSDMQYYRALAASEGANPGAA